MATEPVQALPKGTDDDERVLAEMGYRQELYRGFSGFMAFAFCFTTVSVVPSLAVGFSTAVSLGGSAEIFWAWIFGCPFCVLSGLAMAEITSVYPSAGSVYHWAGQLAPKEWGPLWAYITGWCNLLGNVAGDASFASGFATMLDSAISMKDPDQHLSLHAQVALSVGVLLLWSLGHEARSDHQGWLFNFAIWFQLLAALFIVIVLLTLTPEHATAKHVLTATYDGTGLSSESSQLAWGTMVLGVTNCLFAFTGYESGAHMAEETLDARTSAPWGIVATVFMCAGSGLVFIIGLLFATPDISAYAKDPLKGIFTYAAGPSIGFAMMIMLMIMLMLSGLSSMTTTSRIAYAMARDGALPASSWLRYVNPQTQTPTHCIMFIFALDGLLLLLPLVNKAAMAAFLGSCTIGFQLSYAFPILLRCTSARDSWSPGAWNLGRMSLPVAWIAVVWQLGTCLLYFVPFSYPVTMESMNWTPIVVLLVALIALVNWVFLGRFTFEGPRRSDTTYDLISVA